MELKTSAEPKVTSNEMSKLYIPSANKTTMEHVIARCNNLLVQKTKIQIC